MWLLVTNSRNCLTGAISKSLQSITTNYMKSCNGNCKRIFSQRIQCSKSKDMVLTKAHFGRATFQIRAIRITEKQLVNPLLVFMVKLKGIKVIKALSILFGRTARKLHDKLPEKVQKQLSRHKIFFTTLLAITLTICYYSYVHYDTCPITGRKRWISFTRDQILVLADMDHQQLMAQYEKKLLNKDTFLHKTCLGIVQSLVEHNTDIDMVKDIKWNLNVIDDIDMHNAFVLPNGEIFLFTGMISLMSNWEELAIVLGHEMAHAILGHVQEQQSFAVFSELLVVPLLTFIWFLLDDFAAFIVYSIQHYMLPLIFEVGFNLPYSRQLEMEADDVGLTLAAKACFDPRWSVYLWDKLALKDAVDNFVQNENVDIEFMSSHPSHERRAVLLEARLPEALETRVKCKCPQLSSDDDPIQNAHRLRKFILNIRVRTELMQEIREIKSSPQFNEAQNCEATGIEESDKELKLLEQRLSLLESEFEELLKQGEIGFKAQLQAHKKTALRFKTDPKTKPNGISPAINQWSKIIGNLIKVRTMNSFSSKPDHNQGLTTIDMQSSMFGKHKAYHAKRDYYANLDI